MVADDKVWLSQLKPLCKLCKNSYDLKESHILPRFLGKYLKDTGATGYLTAVDTRGKPSRGQDLYKTKLLCVNCESIISEAETFSANKIFYPFQQRILKSIPVDERLSRFAVSVSLRALWGMQIAQHPLAEKWKQKLKELETEWRNFLLNSPDFVKGDNSHHILLCDENLLAAGVRNSPNLMLSVMRSSAFYLFEKFDKAYVFSNLAGTQVISMIFPAELPVSQGTKVYPEQTFGTTPQGIGWGGYFQNLLALAALSDGATSRLSSAQRARIDRAMNTDRAMKSEDVRILVKQLLALKYLP